jgi:hypothetical protein
LVVEPGREKFQRDATVGSRVMSGVDHTHASFAEFVKDLVV